MRARTAVRILALLLLPACDVGEPAATLEITGDSVVHMALFDLPDGQQNATCRYTLIAHAAGEASDTAVIRQGRVTYSLIDTGQEHGTWEWTPERLATIWEQPRLAGGQTDTSLYHDIAFSQPFHPVRGEVVFDYAVAGDDAVHTTAPFTFACR